MTGDAVPVVSTLRMRIVLLNCVAGEKTRRSRVANAPTDTRCLLTSTRSSSEGVFAYSRVLNSNIKLPFGPRDASSNLLRSEAERVVRS